MTYLLPTPRTPGDHAHLNRGGEPLCKEQLTGVWLDCSDYLCAYNLCPECDRIARGRYRIATFGMGECADGHVFERVNWWPASGTICACGQKVFVVENDKHSVRDTGLLVQARLFEGVI